MIISGLQKLSLLDWPGKVACTVFTGGCNLRCPFCHNSEFLTNPPEFMTVEELQAFLRKKQGLLDGVCVSGGEPCIHKDLEELIRKIRELGFGVKLDTNGFFPERLGRLLDEGLLDYVAMDIKNEPVRYAETVGLPTHNGAQGLLLDADGHLTDILRMPSNGCEQVEESVRRLLRSGIDFELRTTLVKPFHDAESFRGIRAWLEPVLREEGKKLPHYYLQKFVDRETVVFAGLAAPEDAEVAVCLEELKPLTEDAALRGE